MVLPSSREHEGIPDRNMSPAHSVNITNTQNTEVASPRVASPQVASLKVALDTVRASDMYVLFSA